MTSEDPNASQLRFDFLRDEEPQRDATNENIQPDDSVLAAIEKSALGENANNLMEEIVDELNMEMAWARVKANRGAPGPDGITVEDFPEWIAPRWQDVRRQLLDGTYRPDPVRRKAIAKPDGGTRELGIPNLLERLIQTAIVLVLTPIFDPEFAEFRSYAVGWLGYFQLDQVKTTFSRLDKWLRRRVRACYWKQWKKSKTRLHKLMSLGLSYEEARPFAMSGKGPWRLAKTSGVQRALSNAYLNSEGLLSLEERWQQLASLRRTAQCGPAC